MKVFTTALFCFLFVISLAAAGMAHATPVNGDQANEYLTRCMGSAKAPHEGLRVLCTCTAARVMTMLTAEELAVMPEKTPAGQAAMKKMLVDVYAPCTEVVAQEMFDFECVNNKQLAAMNKDFDMPAICGCASHKTAAWYQGKAQTYMNEALQKDPGMTIANPLGGLLNHPVVKSQNLNNLVACSVQPATPEEPVEEPVEGAVEGGPEYMPPVPPQVMP